MHVIGIDTAPAMSGRGLRRSAVRMAVHRISLVACAGSSPYGLQSTPTDEEPSILTRCTAAKLKQLPSRFSVHAKKFLCPRAAPANRVSSASSGAAHQ